MKYSKALKIDPEALRRRCLDIPDCVEIPVSDVPSIVSLLVGSLMGQEVEHVCRVTVYCETGTVAVARVAPFEVVHNHASAVRQVFHRNVSSLDVVERLLRFPPPLTKIDSGLVLHTDGDAEDSLAIRPNLELVDLGLAILEGERDKLASHASSLEPSDPSDCNNQSGKNPEGMEFQFSLPVEAMKHVDQCLKDISSMGRLVRAVSTNGRGTVFLYGNGGVAYTPSIPRALFHKLSQLRKSRDRDSRPSYVSLGTKDRFFVAFHDGTFAFKGPKALERELKKVRKNPASIAFGVLYDTFFIVYDDGSWFYQGKGIPDELVEKLEARDERPDLKCVSLGPSGEWFLRARNGRLWWGGISGEMRQSIATLLDDGHCLNFLDFGEDGSYFISYD